jgi:tol-pal system protein YbgF
MKTIFRVALVALMFPFGCASQTEISTLDQRLSDLDQQARALRQQYRAIEATLDLLDAQVEADEQERGSGELSLRRQTAKLYATVENLGDQVQALSGKIEETDHALLEKSGELDNRGQQRAEKMLRIEATANLNTDRVSRVEKYLGFETSDNLDLAVADSGLEDKSLSDKQLYATAKQAFDRNDIETARQGFQSLLKRFPRSENADNAQFWIGETYYRENWYEKAILEYQKVIEKYPKGNKVPAALLKQGLSFSNLRDKANARLIFEELTKKFPKSTESGIAKKKLRELN